MFSRCSSGPKTEKAPGQGTEPTEPDAGGHDEVKVDQVFSSAIFGNDCAAKYYTNIGGI